MIEYPSILHWKKAPRQECIAFEKLDGSNFRAKWTRKEGFDLFGTRTQLIDETAPTYGEAVALFKANYAGWLNEFFKSDKNYREMREIIVFCEFYGEKTFAGTHIADDPKKLTVIDILTGHKDRHFVKPRELIKYFKGIVELPRVIYEGVLNDEFIRDVKTDKFNTKEGVVCKGVQTSGAHRGAMWQCKIKTENYLQRLRDAKLDMEKYGE